MPPAPTASTLALITCVMTHSKPFQNSQLLVRAVQ